MKRGVLVAATAALVVAALACARAEPPKADPIDGVLAAPDRSAKDRERDALDHPSVVLHFAGFRAGMTVADLFGGGGYYGELLAAAVRPNGRVRLINNATYDREMGAEVAARLAGHRLPNVSYEVADPADLKLGKATLDGVTLVMAYHDLYFAAPERGWPAIDAGSVLEQIATALKPGGVVLVVDHAARVGSGHEHTQQLHRIDEMFTAADFHAHGLELAGAIPTLRNPEDDHTRSVFDPTIRHHTDRFVHLYRKSAPGSKKTT